MDMMGMRGGGMGWRDCLMGHGYPPRRGWVPTFGDYCVTGAFRRKPESKTRLNIGVQLADTGVSPSPQPSPVKRPLRNLPDEAMSGVVNDTILAKPPPLWIPAFAGMTVVQRSPSAGRRRGAHRGTGQALRRYDVMEGHFTNWVRVRKLPAGWQPGLRDPAPVSLRSA